MAGAMDQGGMDFSQGGMEGQMQDTEIYGW